MTRPFALLPLLAACALAAGCVFSIDPDKDRFSCLNDGDCGPRYECRQQAVEGRICYPAGQCVPETCDGADNDCNGVVDNGFNLQTDAANCGTCGHACAAGQTCAAGACSP